MTATMSTHALKRASEMGLTEDEILDTVDRPDIVVPDRGHDDRRVAVKGRLRVVYADGPEPVVCTVLWNGQPSREAGPTTAVPNRASNRALLDQLERWGCTTGRHRGDFLQVRTPAGRLIEVRPADSTRPNPARTITDIYGLLGVSAETFWSRTTRVRPTRTRIHAVPSPSQEPPLSTSPIPDRAPTRRYPGRGLGAESKKVLAHFEANPGEEFANRQVADATGCALKKVQNATHVLTKRGNLTRGRYAGTFRLAGTDLPLVADETADPIDRLRALAAAQRPEPEPVRVVAELMPASIDDEIDATLELLVPGGVKARHLDLAADWVTATRALLQAVRQ